MNFDFDQAPDRRGSDSVKWSRYAGRDVLPLWVADMDFAAPPPVLEALERRIAHGVLGYGAPWPSLLEAVQAHLLDEHGWEIEPAWLVWLPGLVSGLNVACRAVEGAAFTAVPIYPPFLTAPRRLLTAPLRRGMTRWEWDPLGGRGGAHPGGSTLSALPSPQPGGPGLGGGGAARHR